MDLAIQITLMSWMPTPDEAYVLYILAGMWGFTDGIWQTQINGKDIDLHNKRKLQLRVGRYTIFLLGLVLQNTIQLGSKLPDFRPQSPRMCVKKPLINIDFGYRNKVNL